MLRTVVALSVLVALPSCSASRGKQRADGSYVIDCSDEKTCLLRAKRTCGDEGYTVIGGKNNKKKYGAPGNEIYIGKSDLYVRCNSDRPIDAPDPESGEWSLRRADGAAPAAPAKSATPVAVGSRGVPKLVCKPGETQRCYGPAACEGGQACLADGSAFGACDCGKNSAGAKPNESTGALEKPAAAEDPKQ